jgi:hypothetical protein
MRLKALSLTLVSAAALAGVLPAADARPTRVCKSADLRYPYRPGGPKTFGVFRLTITGGSCTTAHATAKAWMKAFEHNIDNGSAKLPRHANGFTFTELPANASQTYRLRGRKDTTSIRFDYVVPNG